MFPTVQIIMFFYHIYKKKDKKTKIKTAFTALKRHSLNKKNL